MRIDIVMNDLTELMACADNVTVLPQRYYDAKHNDNHQQIIPMMEDKQNKSEIEYDDVEMMVEEFKNSRCRCLVIPYSTSVVIPTPGFSKEFVIALVNHKEFEKFLVKPHDYFLEKIIIQVETEKTKESIEKELAIKNTWSKARQLSFILDIFTLNLSQKKICELHYIDKNSYWKYLETFSAECKEELLIRAENIFISKHGKEMKIIFDMIKKFNEINDLYSDLSKKKGTKAQKVLQKVIKLEYWIYWTHRGNDFLLSIIKTYSPFFLYFKHLIPDNKFYIHTSFKIRKIKFTTKQYGIGMDAEISKANPGIDYNQYMAIIEKKYKQREEETLNTLSDIIRNDYKQLVYIIDKIRAVSKLSCSPLPVSMLEDFWDEDTWKEIISKNKNGKYIIVATPIEKYRKLH